MRLDRLEIQDYQESDRASLESLIVALYGVDRAAKSWQHFGEASSTLQTLVARSSGDLLGFATLLKQVFHDYIHLTLNIHPERSLYEIGSELMRALSACTIAHQPLPWRIGFDAGRMGLKEFLISHGFSLDLTTHCPRIDPHLVPPQPILEAYSRVRQLGYRIMPMTKLLESDKEQRLANLHHAIYAQIHPRIPPTQHLFEKRQAAFMGEGLIPEALFVAIKDQQYIGLSSIREAELSEDPGAFDMAWSGVVPLEHSHALDLMLAFKHHELEYALARGIKTLIAEIDEPYDIQVLKVLPYLNPVSSRTWLTMERPPIQAT